MLLKRLWQLTFLCDLCVLCGKKKKPVPGQAGVVEALQQQVHNGMNRSRGASHTSRTVVSYP